MVSVTCFLLGLSSLTVGRRYSQSLLCSIDNRLVDALLSLLEFVGFLEPVNPLNKNEITSLFTLSSSWL
jgi:hypothetical protein